MKTLLDREIGLVFYSGSLVFPFDYSNEFHTFKRLKLLISEEAKRQLIEYELIASYPIYKSLENRCKLIIKKHTHTVEKQYPARVIKGYNSMSIDLKANRIWLIEDESSSEYLDELQDYPTLTSTIVLEDLEKDKYMLVKSYRREYESHMKKILIKLGKGEYFNQPNQDIGMESNIVRKLERP